MTCTHPTGTCQCTNVIQVLPGQGGARGIQGVQGAQGPAGAGADISVSDLAYHHVQNVASSIWNITHNLGFYPNITVVDSAGTVLEGDLEYIDLNNIRVTFSAAFSGNAYLS